MSESQPNQGPTGGVTPHLTIPSRGGAAAIEFYGRAFGAEEIMRMPAEDGERLMHAHLIVNGASLMMHDDFPEYMGHAMAAPSGVTLHLQVDDTDAWYDRAVAAGAAPHMPPADMFWGDRYAQITDPFGHTWSIGTPVKGEK